MTKVSTIAHSSEDDGAAVANALTTPGHEGERPDRRSSRGSPQQERQNVAAAQRLNPPGPLRDENRAIIQALQLRVSGVAGLANDLRDDRRRRSRRTTRRSSPRRRSGCSRATWSGTTSSRIPSTAVMTAKGISGVVAPDSNFVANQDFITEHSMAPRAPAAARRVDRRDADRRARHEHRLHQGEPRRAGAVRRRPRTPSPRAPTSPSPSPCTTAATRRRSGSR